MQTRVMLVVLTIVGATPAYADADGRALTLEAVLRIARERSPASRIARSRVEEARGDVTTARMFLPENPVIEGL